MPLMSLGALWFWGSRAGVRDRTSISYGWGVVLGTWLWVTVGVGSRMHSAGWVVGDAASSSCEFEDEDKQLYVGCGDATNGHYFKIDVIGKYSSS